MVNIELSNKEKFKSYFILISMPIILLAYVYGGSYKVFDQYFSFLSKMYFYDEYKYIFHFFGCFILMFLLPLVIIKSIFKEKLYDYGLRIGDAKYGFTFMAVAIPLIVFPLIYMGTKIPSVQMEYPLTKIISYKLSSFILYEFLYGFYYFGWEFYFRGYMLFGLRKDYGDTSAILLQTIPSVIMHITKPMSEAIGSVIAGYVLGYLALRGNSIYYPFLIHWFIGFLTDFLIVLPNLIK